MQLHHARQHALSKGISSLDAELLLCHVSGLPRTTLYAHPKHTLTPEQYQQFQALLQRRSNGEPLAYLLHQKEFWSLILDVTPDTLIPRPETELLVELALTTLPSDTVQHVADLGTGSGAIALALATERPHWRIIATDNYPATLAVARRNAQRLGITNVAFRQGDWLTALPSTYFDAIISNPPYIAEHDTHLANLTYDPLHALSAGNNGLTALYTIIEQALNYLHADGWLLLEHGFNQALAVQQKLHTMSYQEVVTHRDLAGHARVTMGRKL
jgi:release factor glutamine methyltransferase